MPASPDRVLDFPGTELFNLLHVNTAELDDLVTEHGQAAELRQAVICPCIRPDTGTPSASCVGCRGLGYLYPPTRRSSVVVLLTSRNPKREDKGAGSRVRGDATATFTTGVIPGQGDLLLPSREVHTVNQTIVRARRPELDEGIRARLDPGVALPSIAVQEDRLLYPVVTDVDAIAWRVDDRPTSMPVLAEPGLDFDVEDGNRITWRDGRGPPGGSTFTVRYRAPAAYVVEYDPSVFRAEAGTRYPFRALVHRLDSWNVARNLR